MHAFGRISAGATLFLAVGGGCAVPADDPTAEAAGAATVVNGLHLNGLHLNGLHLNGLHLNGLHLNGLHLNGLHLNGLHLNGSQLNNLKLVNGSLTLVTPAGPLTAAELVGLQATATTADGVSVTLELDAVTRPPGADLTLYTVSYQVPGAAFQPVCGTVDGAPVKAVLLSGTWDESQGTATGGSHVEEPGTFTLACQGYALAKCVELGYAPWRTVTECRAPGDCHSLSLAPFHQACTRMLRGDYCGDGTATTRDGTLVDVWDNVSIQSDDAPGWTFEAEWTPNGAACLTATRWPTIAGDGEAVSSYIQAHCPTRWMAQGCGGAQSTFFAANGFTLPVAQRSLLRTRIAGGM